MQDVSGKTGDWNMSAPTAAEATASAMPSSDAATSALDADVAALAADAEVAARFVTEALDHLGTVESALHQLESTPADPRLLNDVWRSFHAVSASARALGVTTLQELAHTVEDFFNAVRSGTHHMGPREFDVVRMAVDLLTAYMFEFSARVAGNQGEDLEPRRLELIRAVGALSEGGATTPATHDPPEAAGAVSPGTQRASAHVSQAAHTLDHFADRVGELVTLQSLIEQDQALLRVIDERVARNLDQLRRITTDLQRSAASMRIATLRPAPQTVARLVTPPGRSPGKPFERVRPDDDTEVAPRVVGGLNDR